MLPVPLPCSWAPAERFSAWLVQRGHSTCSCTSHLCQGTVQGLLSSGSSSAAGKLQLATKKGGVRPRGSSKRDVFGIAAPAASSSLVCLIFALLSPHQSSLELERPVWHEKAAAAPGLRDTAGGAWHPLPARGTGTGQPQPSCPEWELVLAHPRQSPRDELSVSLLTPQRPSDPAAVCPHTVQDPPALLAQGLAGCSSKIPHLDT